jgi:hypothetical protein
MSEPYKDSQEGQENLKHGQEAAYWEQLYVHPHIHT